MQEELHYSGNPGSIPGCVSTTQWSNGRTPVRRFSTDCRRRRGRERLKLFRGECRKNYMDPRFESGLLHNRGAVAQWVEQCFLHRLSPQIDRIKGDRNVRDHLQRNRAGERRAGEGLDERRSAGRRRAQAAAECRAASVHLQMDCRDAGRPLGHWRDRRQRDPDERARSSPPPWASTSAAA